MMCIRNMVIRKILILRVCGPYLAIWNLIVSGMIWITCIMKRVWRSWRTTSFTVMVNWKNWYHLFIISARIAIPFNVMRCWLYVFNLLFTLFIIRSRDRQSAIAVGVKISEWIICWFWCVTWRSSAYRNVIRRARMIAAPHQDSLSLQNWIICAIWWWRIFNFWLNTWEGFGRCGIWISTGYCHCIACRRSCNRHWRHRCRWAYGWRFWSFIFILPMLNNLVQKFL